MSWILQVAGHRKRTIITKFQPGIRTPSTVVQERQRDSEKKGRKKWIPHRTADDPVLSLNELGAPNREVVHLK